jgi:hypothetical protein
MFVGAYMWSIGTPLTPATGTHWVGFGTRLHAAGIAVYVTPITPRPGYSAQNNLDRHAVSTFVKNGNDCAGTCAGVMDFDQILKDPLAPNSILPAYDTGDGIHANIAGQQALADYVSLPMITN